jgi:hypothetical protein
MLKSTQYSVSLCSYKEFLVQEFCYRPRCSKVLNIVALHSKYTRPLTFENFATATTADGAPIAGHWEYWKGEEGGAKGRGEGAGAGAGVCAFLIGQALMWL